MWKPETENKTLPTYKTAPMEGQQKEIQYTGLHKETSGKRL